MALPSLGGWPAGRSSGRCNNRRILDAEIMPSLHQIPTVLRNVPRKCSSSSTQRQLVIAKAGRSRRSAAASVSSPSTFSDERAVSLDKPNAQASFEDPNTFVPEDYELAPGVLSTVNRTAPAAAEDAFKCIGCTKPECQVCPGITEHLLQFILLHCMLNSSNLGLLQLQSRARLQSRFQPLQLQLFRSSRQCALRTSKQSAGIVLCCSKC
jgi:hypothetical protein